MTVKKNFLDKKVTERRSGSQREAWRLFSCLHVAVLPWKQSSLLKTAAPLCVLSCVVQVPFIIDTQHRGLLSTLPAVNIQGAATSRCLPVTTVVQALGLLSAPLALIKTAFVAFVCFLLATDNAELFSNVHYSVLILK